MHSIRQLAIATLLLVTSAPLVAAQGLSIAVRGGAGLPLGQFAESPSGPGQAELLEGAKTGFGYGLDLTLYPHRMLGVYAGFDRMAFECEDDACGRDNSYTFSGLTAGVKLTPFQIGGVLPWVRGGLIFQQLSGSYRAGSGVGELTSDRAPGFELGAGVTVPILGPVALTPQVRYIGQSPRAKVRGIEYPTDDEVTTSVGYLSFDLGLGFQMPLGGGWPSAGR